MFDYRSFPAACLTIVVALTVASCSEVSGSSDVQSTGSLSLDLVIGEGIVIDEVVWRITGNDMDMSGTIDVSAPGSTASVEVFGLPPGEVDYTVELTAISEDEEVTCQGSANFNVEVGEATDVMVMLNCKLPERLGSVRVNGKFNICAELTKATAAPLRTSVGNDIDLTSQAEDLDGDAILYLWTATGGSIDDPTAPSTTYTCQEAGDQTITIRVTDDDDYCDMATWRFDVTCVPGKAECQSDEDCEAGEVCVAGQCVPDVECVIPADCDDGNQCTINSCPNGMCISENAPAGEACDQSGGSVCDGEGGCVGCNEDEDCAPTEMCTGNMCVARPECTEDPDCDDGNQCTRNVCESEMCLPPSNVSAGEACDQDGGSVCDGEGGCVECISDEECPSRFICTANNTCIPEAETIDLDARVNVSSNPRTVFLDAGTYDVVPIIGRFTAWNLRVGTTNWRHAYRYSSPELGERAFGTPQGSCGGGGSCFTTPEEAFAADATPSTFTLTFSQNVDFFVCDGPGCAGFQGDNEGGVSLLLSLSPP